MVDNKEVERQKSIEAAEKGTQQNKEVQDAIIKRTEKDIAENLKKYKTLYITRGYRFEAVNQLGKYYGMSEEDWVKEIERVIEKAKATGLIDIMAHIYHDKDDPTVDNQGNVTETLIHCHIFVMFKESITNDEVRVLFEDDTGRDDNCKPVTTRIGMSRYLIHASPKAIEDAKVLYQYDDVFVYGSDAYKDITYRQMVKEKFWGNVEQQEDGNQLVDNPEAKRIATRIGLKVRDGFLTVEEAEKELEETAGYHYVREYAFKLKDDRERYIKKRFKQIQKGRNNKHIDIMGGGGIGKSILAIEYATHLVGDDFIGAAAVGKGKTPDPFGKMDGEAVAIINEADHTLFSLNEQLVTFDPYVAATMSARMSDKLFIGHTLLFTNSTSPLRIAKDFLLYSPGGSGYRDSGNERELNTKPDTVNLYWQVRRRKTNLVILLRDKNDINKVIGHVFNLRTDVYKDKDGNVIEDGTHIKMGEISYINKPGERPDISKEALVELERLIYLDANGQYKNVTEIDEFLEDNGMNEIAKSDVMENFIKDVVDKTVWDLLPNEFLYELYKKYREINFGNEDLLNRNQFLNTFEAITEDFKRSENGVRSKNLMIGDEKLISEYGLDIKGFNEPEPVWKKKNYNGDNEIQRRDFERKERYRGFVRIN